MSNDPLDRPQSCPDPWRDDNDEVHPSRPRSVLISHDPDMDNAEFPSSSSKSRQSSASEPTEHNKAKVNSWVESEVEPNSDSDDGNQRLFYQSPNKIAPQHKNVPGIRSSDPVSTRPQTEPGRSRNQSLAGKIKMTARQTIHEVEGSFSPVAQKTDEDLQVQADWVIVEKSSSDTIMPCDPEDDSNVLVPSPNETSTDTNEQSSGSVGRTRMVLSNNFGSTFEVLPQVPDCPTPTEGQATTERKDSVSPGAPTKKRGFSIGHVGAIATSVMKWKSRRSTEARIGYKSLDLEHQKILASESETIKTEIPEAMMKTIKEEAYKIMLKTTSAYRSQIGARHKLTRQAYGYLKELKDELYNCSEEK